MSVTSLSPRLQASDLQRLLREADPAALLVHPKILRRVIKKDRGIGGIGLQVPHRKTYAIRRENLLAIADPDELGRKDAADFQDHLLLIAPEEEWFAKSEPGRVLQELWRLLFHARLDHALADLRASGFLDDARLTSLIDTLGEVELEDAYRVLRQENMILPPGGRADYFQEFVAFFLELRYFAPHLLACYFPGWDKLDHVEKVLLGLLDARAILTATRIPGAAEPMPPEDAADDLETLVLPGKEQSPAKVQKYLAGAESARAKGNLVRSAISRWRAAEAAAPTEKDAAVMDARADLLALAGRLQRALGFEEKEITNWADALLPLLGPASHGMWPASRRLLYDLQSVCVDAERPLYAVDLVEWVCSLFKKPIKRAVPLQAETLLVKHLRAAAQRLPRVRIGAPERDRLAALLRDSIHHREQHLRETVGPILITTLRDAGFLPANHVEKLALEKMAEELLDRIIERGFINMGDVRDAISRNQFKMDDVRPGELVIGDGLIRANRKLAMSLDGIYHRGEFYLRWLQRFSSLLFGTIPGRWLVLYLILPFGGAFATAIFAQEMLHLGQVHVHFYNRSVPVLPGEDPRTAYAGKPGVHLWVDRVDLVIGLAILGIFYLLLLHWPAFRTGTWLVTKKGWHLIRLVFWDLPVGFFHLSLIRAFLESSPVAFFRRRLLRPLVVALVATACWYLLGFAGFLDDLAILVGTFVLGLLFFNSRLGLITEEALSDWLVRNWDWLRVDVIPGTIRFFIYFFKMILDRLERIIYSVDETLRFRPGEGKLSLLLKPILGLGWFVLTYLVRVIINLFVEPTVNPIKHFPAVTVGAKVIIPLIPMWSLAMTEALQPFMGIALAGAVAGTVILLFPGIFGFAVWEFKENWKLYRANRSQTLRPVMIGHHGETMLRFLKPGFHSGTLPKLFAKLRRAKRRGELGQAHKQVEQLHHVEESLCHFLDREFLTLLRQSRTWGGQKVGVGEIKLAGNQIRIELSGAGEGVNPVTLTFEERDGKLHGRIAEQGWLPLLGADQQTTFDTALAGLFALAGVEGEKGLADGEGAEGLAPRPEMIRPIGWEEWRDAWEKDQGGQVPVLAR